MILFSIRKAAEAHTGKEDEEEEVETSREFVRWIARDHSRPCVGLQQSPFFSDILLSVGDWNFHIWKVRIRGLYYPAHLRTFFVYDYAPFYLFEDVEIDCQINLVCSYNKIFLKVAIIFY